MAIIKPIFRIFDYDKAIDFYVHWLGFAVDWEHVFEQGENPGHTGLAVMRYLLT